MTDSRISFTLKLARAYLPAIVWAGVIFLLSSQSGLPSLDTDGADFLLKKSAHLFVYAVLYWFLLLGTIRWSTNQTIQTWLPILLVLLYAITDEIHQTFVPFRFGTVRDIGYDMLGATIVWLYIHSHLPRIGDQFLK